MGSGFQNFSSKVKIVLENEFGQKQELLDSWENLDVNTAPTATSDAMQPDSEDRNIRESALTAWYKAARDRRRKLQKLLEEYNELVIAVRVRT
ncbi:unnamed protein product [Mesocestoides corti]|uniref:Uncharacterized protein n=1 Tax=Mesocestoides corti TaxID=53468 RepID=A0A0R3U4F9_MESCO|nr:unnamed protein product [Mesocestoides corti]